MSDTFSMPVALTRSENQLANTRVIERVLSALLFCIIAAGVRQGYSMLDFTAFVCGGEAVAEHENPYMREPLAQCEAQRFAAMGEPAELGLILPAPLPPYALVPFAIMSRLPVRLAVAAYTTFLALSVTATVVLLRRMTGLSAMFLFAAVAVTDVYVSLPLGQLVPFMIAGATISAWALETRRPRTAAFAALGTMMEPHLGLPLCAALFCIEARSRRWLLWGTVLLAALSLAAQSWTSNIRYLMRTLPAHAASEVHSVFQLSVTHLLWLAGVPERGALLVGSVSYAVCCIAGVVIAMRLARRDGYRAAALICAPVLALAGGTFVHVQQYCLVSVLAVLVAALARNAQPDDSDRAILGTMLLAMPLIGLNGWLDALANCTAACLIASNLSPRRRAPACAFAFAICCASLYIHQAVAALPVDPATARAHEVRLRWVNAHAPTPEEIWAVRINEGHYATSLGRFGPLLDAPMWCGLGLVGFVLLGRFRDGGGGQTSQKREGCESA